MRLGISLEIEPFGYGKRRSVQTKHLAKASHFHLFQSQSGFHTAYIGKGIACNELQFHYQIYFQLHWVGLIVRDPVSTIESKGSRAETIRGIRSATKPKRERKS
jgi:hypothetical protein